VLRVELIRATAAAATAEVSAASAGADAAAATTAVTANAERTDIAAAALTTRSTGTPTAVLRGATAAPAAAMAATAILATGAIIATTGAPTAAGTTASPRSGVRTSDSAAATRYKNAILQRVAALADIGCAATAEARVVASGPRGSSRAAAVIATADAVCRSTDEYCESLSRIDGEFGKHARAASRFCVIVPRRGSATTGGSQRDDDNRLHACGDRKRLLRARVFKNLLVRKRSPCVGRCRTRDRRLRSAAAREQ
jgi:hypothetical protein